MKLIRFLILTVITAPILSALAQGAFQNLDFETATIPQSQAQGPVSAAAAFPDWTVFVGTFQLTQVLFNDATLGTTSVSLVGTNGIGTTKSIEGGYSVLLQGGVTASDASIRQTGLIPSLAESIMFKAQPGFGQLNVSLGGQNVQVFTLGTGPNYTLYGCDVMAFAGQVEELELSALNGRVVGPNDWEIDSIVFSPTAVPEPETWALMLCGAVLFGIGRWKQKA